MTQALPALERQARTLLEAGDRTRAASLLINAYGDELLGFLNGRLRDPDLADDCFALLIERIWSRLDQLQWRTTARAWCYSLARNAAVDAFRARGSGRRRVAMDDVPELRDLAEAVRTRTRPYLRTEVKDAMRRLRESLDDADQLMLLLRLDRGLDWNEVAQAMADESLGTPELRRESARLRKRFELVKQRLRERAEAEGLLEAPP